MVRSRLTTCLGAQNESSIVTCVNASGAYCWRTALAVSSVGLAVVVLKICFLCLAFHMVFSKWHNAAHFQYVVFALVERKNDMHLIVKYRSAEGKSPAWQAEYKG